MASTSIAAAHLLLLRPPPRLAGIHRHPPKPASLASPQLRCRNPSRLPIFASLPSSSSYPSSSGPTLWEREEARWILEEHRWLREEQRWLREESRWRAEREVLLREVAALRLRVEELQRGIPSFEALVVAPELQGKGEVGRIAGAASRPVLVEEVKEMILEEVRVSDSIGDGKREEEEKKKESKWRLLRMGSEGEDVRAMQEALQRLGFYSGEEDMEFASFSSGTERAVKTWQASRGSHEDGIMTTELLEILYMGETVGNAHSKDHTNGAVVASLTEITVVQQKVVKENVDAEVNVSRHRVFLLGENRWEEPSRLVGKDKPIDRSQAVSATKCLSCRGEGRSTCTECDGSGEPNIEPQFMEWIDEGTKCPYCEGLGYTICNVCQGRTAVET